MEEEEYIDILTSEGVHTGKKDTKDNIHKFGYWHNTAHIWVLNDSDEVLIQRRHPSRKTFGGLWDVSVAGHISAGETIKQGAVREVREEIGIDISEKDLVFMFTEKSSTIFDNINYINNEFFNVFLINKNISIDGLNIHKHEVAEIRYINLNDLEKEIIINFANRGSYYIKSIESIKYIQKNGK